MTNGSFTELEQQSGVVPFYIQTEEEVLAFHKTYFLVDGIYPRYNRFVKGMSSAMEDHDSRFTAW